MRVPLIVSLDGPAHIGAGSAFVVVVRLDAVTQRITPIQVGCSHAGVVTNPFKTWPVTMLVPTGHDSLSVPLYVQSVTRDTSVTLYACESGVNAAAPTNWRAQMTVVIEPPTVSQP